MPSVFKKKNDGKKRNVNEFLFPSAKIDISRAIPRYIKIKINSFKSKEVSQVHNSQDWFVGFGKQVLPLLSLEQYLFVHSLHLKTGF